MSKIDELKKRFMNFYPLDGINDDDIKEIQKELGLELPLDFCEISKFFSGSMLGDISIFSFTRINGTENIIDETLRLRKTVKLPHEYIVLAEPSESIILLNTQNQPVVLWIDATEITEISIMSFESTPDVWDSFEDFFNELLQQEEQDRDA
jgi:hypothetical protein